MGFTAIILSKDEALALPPEKRPMNYRVPSKIYHDVFEAVGSLDESARGAVDLLFKIAAELERLGVTYESTNGFRGRVESEKKE